MELVGHTLGQYRVFEELGRGGMGVVYRAEDLRLRREVALKVLPAELALHEDRVARLRGEARSLASLNHPCIVTLYAMEEIGGQLLLAMELVEGKTLGQLIPARGFDLEKFFRLALPFLDAVSAAHREGVVHRDLKLENVMVTPEGRIKVLDFGLAKLRADTVVPDASQLATESLTAAGIVVGTVPYMAPEQIRGGPADQRSDIFSLGVILYQMATGRHPFKSHSPADLVSSILRDDPPSLITLKPGLPRQLDRILQCALEKNPERRFQSATELRNQIERLEEETTEGATPEPAPPARAVRWRPAAGVAVFLLLASGLGLWILRSRSQPALSLRLPHLRVTDFRRFSGEAGPQYYRSGLVAALAERLSGLRGVWVLPGGAADPLPDLLVEADVRRLSDALELQLRVQERQSRRILGSEVLAGTVGEPFDLLDRAGTSVAALLRAEAGLPVRYRAGPVPTQNPTAFDLLLRAQDLLADGRGPPNEAALVLIRQALEEDPRLAQAWVLEGELRLRRYRGSRDPATLDEAAEACRQAVETGPDPAAGHLCLARVQRALRRPLQAQEHYLRTIALHPTALDAYEELRDVFLELDVPVTEATWTRVIDLHPGYWAGYWSLGGFYAHSGRYDAAIEQYRRALERAPDNALVHVWLGSAQYMLGRYEEAITAYQRSLDLHPNHRAFSNLGNVHLLLRRFPEAVESFERSVEFPEADYVAFGNLATAYFWATGRREQAKPAFERTMALCREYLGENPDGAGAWSWLAYSLAMLQRGEESRAAVEEALKRHPTDPFYSYWAARILNRLGKEEEALGWLERAVDGGYPRAEIRLGVEFDNLRDEPRFKALLGGP